MTKSENKKLQELCRHYLSKLRPIAQKFGLGGFMDEIINANLRNECEGTQEEVEMLSRCVDDERVSRGDIPKMLGKSYRECFENDDFANIKKLKRVGIYSKVSALLYGAKKVNDYEV